MTRELNHALVLRLAGEFQGFSRDLHDEACDAVRAAALASAPRLDVIVRQLMTSGRKLDSGNATWSNICSDFARLGCDLPADLRARFPAQYAPWMDKLLRLNRARNALAHQDRVRISECEREDPLNFSTFATWRSAVARIAVGLDMVVERYLTTLNGVRPW